MTSENVPPGILDMLKIFLAAKSRGEQAVLVLETKNGILTTKYRSVESNAGAPAYTSTSTSNIKKVNPARARRSKLRQEQFMKKKMADKKKQLSGEQNGGYQAAHDAGETSNKTNHQLLLNLGESRDCPMETILSSPIPQVDGGEHPMEEDLYSFISDYGEEDILFSLDEVFPPEKVATLLSRDPVSAALSADHLCHVKLRPVQGKKTCWPVLGPSNVDVFKDVKPIK